MKKGLMLIMRLFISKIFNTPNSLNWVSKYNFQLMDGYFTDKLLIVSSFVFSFSYDSGFSLFVLSVQLVR